MPDAFKPAIALLAAAAALPALAAEPARLRVEIRDASSGSVVPARVYLFDRQGKLHVPERAIVYRKHQEEHFISGGSFDLALPARGYTLAVERGPEYHPWSEELRLAEGETKQIEVELKRWISMNKRGWYSGDLHNHRKPEEMPDLLAAEDLNLAPTLTDWIWEERPISKPPATTEAIRRVGATRAYSVLDKEVERLNHGPGAVDLLGLKTPIPFEGNWLYPPNDTFCRLAHAQGGYVDAEKITWRDVPALVAFGHVDFAGVVHNHFNRHGVELETDQWGMAPKDRPEYNTPRGMALWTLDVYYRFLNCGFRLPVSAGSASAVKAAPLGYNRVYVHLDRPFSYEDWFHALKDGRSFATNGPMLFLKVNGRLPGSAVELPEGKTSRVKIEAEVQSARPLESLEVLYKGRVVRRAQPSPSARHFQLRLDLPVGETGWIAARAFEQPDKTIRYAQTSPIYLRAGGSSGIVAEDARYFAAWMRREKEFYRKETRFQSPAHRDAMVELFEKAEAFYERLAAEGSGPAERSKP